jgi:hypothetical protein
VLLPPGLSAETIFLRPGHGVSRFYFEGANGRGVTAFKVAVRKFFKVLAVYRIGLKRDLLPLPIPFFLLRISFYIKDISQITSRCIVQLHQLLQKFQ